MANSFLHSEDEFTLERRFPLDVFICETCHLVQLLDVIDPEVLFRNYIYLTGTSDTIAAHNKDYSQEVTSILGLSAEDLVIEAASNDGSLLKCFQERSVRVLGIEPAENIAAMANANGIPTVSEFFNLQKSHEIRNHYGPARAVIGNNVLAHVDEPRDFLSGFKYLLTPDGMAIVEVPYLRELIDRLEYDTIYHEHLCYFSIGALVKLFESVGLSVLRVEYFPVHGGSLRVYAGSPDYYGGHSTDVLAMVREEEVLGLASLELYDSFSQKVEKNRAELLGLLNRLKKSGYSLAGYGAPAKGNTLLNYCGISADTIDFTVDKNQWKVGLFTPGSHLPVLPASTLLERQPDFVLILAWNFASEIMQQQQEYRKQGGRFIIPIPEPVVV